MEKKTKPKFRIVKFSEIAKCPKCKERLTDLINVVSGQAIYPFTINDDGEPEYDTLDFQDDGEENNYRCPICDEIIALSEADAIELFKGDSMKPQLRTKKDRQALKQRAKDLIEQFNRYADKMKTLKELLGTSSQEDLISIYEPTLKRWEQLDFDVLMKEGKITLED